MYGNSGDSEPRIINISSPKKEVKHSKKPVRLKTLSNKLSEYASFLGSRSNRFILIIVLIIFTASLYLLYVGILFEEGMVEEDIGGTQNISDVKEEIRELVPEDNEYIDWNYREWGDIKIYFPEGFNLIRGDFDAEHFSLVERTGNDYLSYIQISGDVLKPEAYIDVSLNKLIGQRRELYQDLEIKEKNIYSENDASFEYLATLTDLEVRIYVYEYLSISKGSLYTIKIITPEVTWVRRKELVDKIIRGIGS